MTGAWPWALLAVMVTAAVVLWPVDGRPSAGGAVTARRRTGPRSSAVVVALRRLRARVGGAREEVHVLDTLAAGLESGLPTDLALRLALDAALDHGRLPVPWADLHRAAELGLPLTPAWSRVARRTGSATAVTAGRAWAVATASGAPLAAAIRSSAHAARERHRLERAVEVATAGARATATVLALLPVAGVGLAAILGVAPTTLYGSLPAAVCAAAGLGLLLVGHLVVRAMVSRVVAGVS